MYKIILYAQYIHASIGHALSAPVCYNSKLIIAFYFNGSEILLEPKR
jgi:hypothetical protein